MNEADAPRLLGNNEGHQQWHMRFLKKTGRSSAEEETV